MPDFRFSPCLFGNTVRFGLDRDVNYQIIGGLGTTAASHRGDTHAGNQTGGQTLSEISSSERRRTARVHIAMPIIVRCRDSKPPLEEKTHTVSVNANGCLLRLQAMVIRTQKLLLVNPQTTEELPCTVIFVGKRDGGKTEVGLEFAEASPLFWRISFPPDDWDPSERKKPMTARPAPVPPRH
jgi:hypothetical protein